MKTYLITISLSLFLFAPLVVFAAATDVSMSSPSVISVGGYSLAVSGTASFDSITVYADYFIISLSKNASLTVTSATKQTFTVSPVQYNTHFTCGSDSSTLTVGNNVSDTAVTVTVTPSSSTCSSGPTGGWSPGYTSPSTTTTTTTPAPAPAAAVVVTPPVTTAATTPAAATVESLQQTLNALIAQLKTILLDMKAKGEALPPGMEQYLGPTGYTFTRGLTIGSKGEDVKALQQFLNSQGFTIANSGPGSSGNESTYFGPLTKSAVQKFQVKYGLAKAGDSAFGYVGPKTRAKIQELLK